MIVNERLGSTWIIYGLPNPRLRCPGEYTYSHHNHTTAPPPTTPRTASPPPSPSSARKQFHPRQISIGSSAVLRVCPLAAFLIPISEWPAYSSPNSFFHARALAGNVTIEEFMSTGVVEYFTPAGNRGGPAGKTMPEDH